MSESLHSGETVTAAEIEEVVRIFAKLHKGYLPEDIFNAVAEKTVTPIIELVPLRRNAEGQTEILLTRRPKGDSIWSGMLHVPGTVVRATDQAGAGNEDAFRRLTQGELNATQLGEPVLAHRLLHASERGMEQSQVFWAEVMGEPGAGEFYPAHDLPPDLVPSQLDFIPVAVQNYEQALASRA